MAMLKDENMHSSLTMTIFTNRYLRLTTITVVACAIAACASKSEERTQIQDLSEAYELAQTSILRKNYAKGIQIFEAIQARYPFSDLSRQIQLELMHAYYQRGSKEQAIDAADTFMQENPIHPQVDYALYIKALAFFENDPGILERWFRRDITTRPPEDVDLAYSTLRRLVERFPNSEYAPDAEQRIIAIKNRMSTYENHVADYYLRRGAYVAAANRAKTALEEYNGSPANEESLRIMIEAYDALGMADLAADARKVMASNFP
ncbi:MAG: outer membrane protein assembly factor BamD [Gammaproteobacteria bacterium]|nr:outer membrane protein assembly factor BamD [Gammaproteobacteria bacterium]